MFEVRYYPKALGIESKEIKKIFNSYKEAKKFFNSLKFVYKFFNFSFDGFTFVGNSTNINYGNINLVTSDIKFDINGNRLKDNNLKALFIENKDLLAYNTLMNQKN